MLAVVEGLLAWQEINFEKVVPFRFYGDCAEAQGGGPNVFMLEMLRPSEL